MRRANGMNLSTSTTKKLVSGLVLIQLPLGSYSR